MRRRKLKTMNLKAISIIAVAIFFLTISVGYSYLQQKLNIYGKSTIVPQNEEGYLKGNSTFSWSIVNVDEQDKFKTYEINLIIINKDADISSWEIAFDIPQGYIDSKSNVENGVSKRIENNRLILTSATDSNGYLSKGSKLEINIDLTFTNDKFEINNLTLNDRLASYNK